MSHLQFGLVLLGDVAYAMALMWLVMFTAILVVMFQWDRALQVLLFRHLFLKFPLSIQTCIKTMP